jgi:hypothetical protein
VRARGDFFFCFFADARCSKLRPIIGLDARQHDGLARCMLPPPTLPPPPPIPLSVFPRLPLSSDSTRRVTTGIELHD